MTPRKSQLSLWSIQVAVAVAAVAVALAVQAGNVVSPTVVIVQAALLLLLAMMVRKRTEARFKIWRAVLQTMACGVAGAVVLGAAGWLVDMVFALSAWTEIRPVLGAYLVPIGFILGLAYPAVVVLNRWRGTRRKVDDDFT